MRVVPEDVGGQVDVILGNPPFVRHHVLSESQRKIARKACDADRLGLSRGADYWAYFVVYSLKFLSEGARIAMILPGSFLRADYARPVRNLLLDHFRHVKYVLIHDVLFSGTQAETLILLADGYGERASKVVAANGRASDLASLVLDATSDVLVPKEHWYRSWEIAGVGKRAVKILESLAIESHALGDLAEIRIGTVTGANDFFLISSEDRERLGLSLTQVTPAIVSSRKLTTLCLTSAAFSELVANGSKCFVITLQKGGRIPTATRDLIRRAEADGIHLRCHCAKRKPWYGLKPVRPDAFLSYMSHYGPRITLNDIGATCTNSLHALRWKESGVSATRIALGILSTPAQLSAEIVGRVYGGGVLKLEPSDASKVLIPPLAGARLRGTLSEMSYRLKQGKVSELTDIADGFLPRAILSQRDLDVLRDELETVRRRRDVDLVGRRAMTSPA